MSQNRNRGRPPTFQWAVRKKLADQIREHGARGAQDLSNIPISMPTLLKIAREFEIKLKKGRRPHHAA